MFAISGTRGSSGFGSASSTWIMIIRQLLWCFTYENNGIGESTCSEVRTEERLIEGFQEPWGAGCECDEEECYNSRQKLPWVCRGRFCRLHQCLGGTQGWWTWLWDQGWLFELELLNFDFVPNSFLALWNRQHKTSSAEAPGDNALELKPPTWKDLPAGNVTNVPRHDIATW